MRQSVAQGEPNRRVAWVTVNGPSFELVERWKYWSLDHVADESSNLAPSDNPRSLPSLAYGWLDMGY